MGAPLHFRLARECACVAIALALSCSSGQPANRAVAGSGAATGAASGDQPSSGNPSAGASSGTPSSGTVTQSSGGTSGVVTGSGAGATASTGASTTGLATSGAVNSGSGIGVSSGSGAAGGSGGASMSGGATSGSDETLPDGGQGIGADTPPWRPLMVTASPGEHIHGSAGVDTRSHLLGKLAVDIGVNSGSYQSWLSARGYHSMGAPCGACAAPNLGAGRDAVGACRLMEFANTEASVKSTLTSLAQNYPTEDWGYFLNQDGSVRWSDVAITGVSHGATTAAVAGRLGARMWRVVSRAGPRDDTCGVAGGVSPTPTFDPSNPPWKVPCPPADIASWMDMPSITPIDRFYGLVGTTDVEYGDIMFDMHYTGYPGPPVQWNVAGAVLTGNQFYSTTGGHLDFLGAAAGVMPTNTDAVLNLAFGIPLANQNPTF